MDRLGLGMILTLAGEALGKVEQESEGKGGK